MAGKAPQRSSVSSRGSPSDENAPAVPPTARFVYKAFLFESQPLHHQLKCSEIPVNCKNYCQISFLLLFSYSRGSSISGAPPPIPERTTPGPGSIGRHGSLSSVSSDLPEQPTEKAPTLASVGRRDSAGKI